MLTNATNAKLKPVTHSLLILFISISPSLMKSQKAEKPYQYVGLLYYIGKMECFCIVQSGFSLSSLVL